MDKKIKILVVPSDHGGCGFFRSTQPHLYIAEHYSDLFDIEIMYHLPTDTPLDQFLSKYDIVHIHEHRQTLAIFTSHFARKNNRNRSTKS